MLRRIEPSGRGVQVARRARLCGCGGATLAHGGPVALLFDPPPQPPATSVATQIETTARQRPIVAACVVSAIASARCTSPNAIRPTRFRSTSSSIVREAVHSSRRGRQQLVDLLRLLGEAVALQRGVDREAERAQHVSLAQPEERGRHRDVVVDAGERRSAARTSPDPRGGVSGACGSSSTIRRADPPSTRRSASSS